MRTDDREVMAVAAREQRVLITEDKDFGWLAFVGGAEHEGVLLIRFPGNERQTLAGAVQDLVAEHGEKLRGSFTVLQPGLARIMRQP